MIDYTINDDKTIVGGGKDVILAGRYHILRQLGKGGMGAVWLAEDRQLDNRKVAIKMLPSILVADKRSYQQLKGEALVSLKLVHPNIVTLRAFEENNGAPFLVMDYIEGQTLSDYLAIKGKLSEAETIKLLNPIAVALDYAHSEKVIHRDVKPSNIIIRKDGHPFILDFGIAREIQESMTRVTGRTISGTLLYMSPEQLRGAPPTPAQDVYSFAVMCYECLKGEPPFTRGNIVYQIINEKPVKLFGETTIVKSVMCGLAKNPHDRPLKCMSVLGIDSAIGYAMPATHLTRKTTKLVWLVLVLLGIVVTGVVWWSGFRQSEVQEPLELKNITVAGHAPSGEVKTNFPTSSETCINVVDTNQKGDESANASESHVEVIHQDEGKALLLSELKPYEDGYEKVTPSQEQTVVALSTTNRSEVGSPTGGVGINHSNEYEKTKDILSGIESSLLEYRRLTKALPSSLKELQIHIGVPSLFDVWGTEIYYETDGVAYALQSAGPDKNFEKESDNITLIRQSQINTQTNKIDSKADTIDGGSFKADLSSKKGRLGLIDTAQSIVGFEFGKPYVLFNVVGVEAKSDTTISFRHDLQLTNGTSFVGLTGLERGVVDFEVKSQKMSSVRLISSAFSRGEACERIEMCRKELKKYGCDDSLWPSVPTTISEQTVIKFADMALNNRVSMMFCGLGQKDKLVLEIHIIDMPILKAIIGGSGFVPEDQLPSLKSLFSMPFGADVTKEIIDPIPQDNGVGGVYYSFKPKKSFFNFDYYVCATRQGDNRIFGISCMKVMPKAEACTQIPVIVATLEARYQRKFIRAQDKKNTWEMHFYDPSRKSSDGFFLANKIIRLNMNEQDKDKYLVLVTAIEEELKAMLFTVDPSSMKAL